MTRNPDLGRYNIDYDNQDGSTSSDDGPIDGYYPPSPAPKSENPWKSLEDYGRSYNESAQQAVDKFVDDLDNAYAETMEARRRGTAEPHRHPEVKPSREQQAVDKFVDDLDNAYAETMEAQRRETAELQRHLEEMQGKPDDFFNPDADVYYNGGKGDSKPATPEEKAKYGGLYGEKRSFNTFDLNPRQEGETSREYGDRLFDGYTMNVVAQHIRRDVSGKEPESHEHHQQRIKDFISRYPRMKGESVEDYAKRIEAIFASGKVDSSGNDVEPKGDQDDIPTKTDPNKTDPHKVEIGDVELDRINEEIDQIGDKRIKELEERLKGLMPTLAELYARNRRLIVGKENKVAFERARGLYGELLDEYLILKARRDQAHLTGEAMNTVNDSIEAKVNEIREKLIEFAGGDLEKTEKTQEEIDAEKQRLIKEANEAITNEYGDLMAEVKTKVNADFIDDLIKSQVELEDATIDALDNGTLCRKVVHKIINNKVLKGVLVGAGLVGLAVTGVGVATGTVALGFSLTAGGIAAGTAKGAGSGLLMSRQDSRNSAIRGYGERSREELKKRFEGIDILQRDGETEDIRNVAGWLMGGYNEANQADRKTNIKKTAIATGLGAIIGGIMSGVHFNKTVQGVKPETKIIGYTPERYEVDYSQVDIPHGQGMYETFAQMGGDPANQDLAVELAWTLDAKHGLVPKSNGITEGVNGLVGAFAHTYEGPINTWPPEAQAYIKDVFQLWAKHNLIPATEIPAQPVFGPGFKAVTKIVPSQFMNFIARRLEAILPAAFGGLVGGVAERTRSRRPEGPTGPETSEPEPDRPKDAEPEPTEPETTDEAGETGETDRPREALNAYMNSLKRALDSNLIGGRDSLRFFYYNPDDPVSDAEFQTYWDGLGDDGKRVVRTILDNSSAIPFSQPFRNWLSSQDAGGATVNATA